MFEAVKHPTLYLPSILGTFILHPYAVTSVHNFGILGVRVSPNNIMVSVVFEAVRHPTLYLPSISIFNAYEVFQHRHKEIKKLV
jgi:hypothetical protein